MKKVLFVCIGNSARSQMAEGYLKAIGGGRFKVRSAGTNPASRVSSNAVKVMNEVGIDISGASPKMLTSEMIKDADLVVTMGCGVEKLCPYFNPAVMKKSVDWNLPDPKDQGIEFFREIRDRIKEKIDELIEEMDV